MSTSKKKTYFEEHHLELLAEARLNKAQFAARMGVARQNIQKIFETKSIITLQKAAEVLGVPLEILLSGKTKSSINGFIEANNTIHSIRNVRQLAQIMDQLDGAVHIKSFSYQDEHKLFIKDFFCRSVLQGKSDAIMAKYGWREVFCLAYDAQSERLFLTLCIDDGKIRWLLLDTNDHKSGENFTDNGINIMLEKILSEIEQIDEE